MPPEGVAEPVDGTVDAEPGEQVGGRVGGARDVARAEQGLAEAQARRVDQHVAATRREQRDQRVPGVAVDEHRRPQDGRCAVPDRAHVQPAETGGDRGGAFRGAVVHGRPPDWIRVSLTHMNIDVSLVVMKSNPPRAYRMTARAEAAERTGERIIDAMLRRYAEVPYDRLRLEDVAADAEVTVQTVLRRFGSKPGLLAATVERELVRLAGERAAAHGRRARRARCSSLVRHYEDHGALILKMYAEAPPGARRARARRAGSRLPRRLVPRGVRRGAGGGAGRGDARRRLAQVVAICDATTWRILRFDGRSVARADRAGAGGAAAPAAGVSGEEEGVRRAAGRPRRSPATPTSPRSWLPSPRVTNAAPQPAAGSVQAEQPPAPPIPSSTRPSSSLTWKPSVQVTSRSRTRSCPVAAGSTYARHRSWPSRVATRPSGRTTSS